jgi:hypothetical protein
LTGFFAQHIPVGMNSVINFVEFENQVISATYRNLMIGARVVLVDVTSGDQLVDPVTRITSPVPNGSLRIRLPASVKPGAYFLRALNGHGDHVAESVQFYIG